MGQLAVGSLLLLLSGFGAAELAAAAAAPAATASTAADSATIGASTACSGSARAAVTISKPREREKHRLGSAPVKSGYLNAFREEVASAEIG